MPFAPASRARLQATCASAGTLVLWYWRGGIVPAALAGVMAALALVAWTSPARYAPIQRVLDRGVHLLLAGLTWVLLGVIWLVVFTPWRFLRSLTGTDPLRRKFDQSADTYLSTPPPGVSGRFDRQF
ncbi:MAG TPA: hypothetical protein VG734_05065 [Lacunisphaera sp.]|nr:hypothetical protein [Lacunisphaera sp.]